MAVYRVKVTRRLVLETTVLVRADTVTQAMDSASGHAAENLSDDAFDVASHDEDVMVVGVAAPEEQTGEEVVDRNS